MKKTLQTPVVAGLLLLMTQLSPLATEAGNNRAAKLGLPDPKAPAKPLPDKKLKELKHSLSNDPLERGKQLMYRANYPEALKNLNKAIEKDPASSPAYSARAFTYESMGKHDEAIADATKAISLDASNQEAYGIRMKAFTATHQMDAGASDLKTVLSLNEQGYMKTAGTQLANCNKKIKRDPTSTSNYLDRAGTYRALHQFPKALDDYNEAIKRDPHSYMAYYNRAQVYLQMNRHDLADQDFALAQQLAKQQQGKARVNHIK